jgi:hypothetical protein
MMGPLEKDSCLPQGGTQAHPLSSGTSPHRACWKPRVLCTLTPVDLEETARQDSYSCSPSVSTRTSGHRKVLGMPQLPTGPLSSIIEVCFPFVHSLNHSWDPNGCVQWEETPCSPLDDHWQQEIRLRHKSTLE